FSATISASSRRAGSPPAARRSERSHTTQPASRAKRQPSSAMPGQLPAVPRTFLRDLDRDKDVSALDLHRVDGKLALCLHTDEQQLRIALDLSGDEIELGLMQWADHRAVLDLAAAQVEAEMRALALRGAVFTADIG